MKKSIGYIQNPSVGGVYELKEQYNLSLENIWGNLEMTYASSSHGLNVSSLSLPSGTQVGDLVFAFDNTDYSSTDYGTPDGWNRIVWATDGSYISAESCYTVVTQEILSSGYISSNSNSSNHDIGLLSFRPNVSIGSVSISGLSEATSTSNPDPQTLLASDISSIPVIGILLCSTRASLGGGTASTVPDNDGSLIFSDAGTEIYYKIYNHGDTTSDLTIDMDDPSRQTMQSFWINLSK